MADYFALTREPLPASLFGSDGGYSVRTLSNAERHAIEDYFSKREIKIALDSNATAVVVPQGETAGASPSDIQLLVEFALGVLTVSGFQPVHIVATMTSTACSAGLLCDTGQGASNPVVFAKKLTKAAASTWMRRFFGARPKSKNKLHITADRFVRYLRAGDSCDALVDLCICLESLIESQTEISFRFGTYLAKVSGLKNPQEISALLQDLYDLRSKVVHGTDFVKQHKKILPSLERLRFVARAVLSAYVLFLTEHTSSEWKSHLHKSLFT